LSGYPSVSECVLNLCGKPLLSDTEFTFNIQTDSTADADLSCQLLPNSVTKQELRIRM